MKNLLRALVLLSFVPWANGATIDLTENVWDFNARLFNVDSGFASANLTGSTLLFEEQTLNSSGNYSLEGTLNWVINGSTGPTSSMFGQLTAGNDITMVTNTNGVFFTLFQGLVEPVSGLFMVGRLDGLFRSDMEGFWYATRGIERSGPTPIAIPTSALLFLSALGIGFVMVRRG